MKYIRTPDKLSVASGYPYISWNGCISFNIGPNPTKLEDFVKLGVLFLAVGVLCPIAHNTQTRAHSPTI